MSHALLDDLQAWMPFSAEMRYVLENVRMNVEPSALRHRLEKMVSQR